MSGGGAWLRTPPPAVRGEGSWTGVLQTPAELIRARTELFLHLQERPRCAMTVSAVDALPETV